MFGPRIPGLSIGKVIGGISKTLGIVNQAIPIYKEATPMIKNAKAAIGMLKEFSNKGVNNTIQKVNKNVSPRITNIKNNNLKNNTKNGPTFFQ